MHISDALRKYVIDRAENRCEYCRIPALVAGFSFHIEHIIALQHDGETVADNLALSCPWCNKKKGPNIATRSADGTRLVPLFHPRKQNWFEHFGIHQGLFIGKTEIGESTIRLLDLNRADLVYQRQEMEAAGLLS
jgi:hypothetical protein